MEEAQKKYQRMLRRHEREKWELQAQIAAMKSEVPRSDKKKRTQLLVEVDRLEEKLEQKQEKELENFRSALPESSSLASVTEEMEKMDLENQHPRYVRAQKRRERKAALEREHQERLTDAQVEKVTSYQRNEEKRLAAILEARNLEMKEIQADSHCMYRAILDQLRARETVEKLRARTAEYMRLHVDEFLPFFSESETGDVCTHDDYLHYCDMVMGSASWGSQVELRALSHVLRRPIEVVQADAPIVTVGEEYTAKPITLVYIHYTCDLGEHYNSVKPLEAGAVGGGPARLF